MRQYYRILVLAYFPANVNNIVTLRRVPSSGAVVTVSASSAPTTITLTELDIDFRMYKIKQVVKDFFHERSHRMSCRY